jgi:polyisoprenyl-phosphate glycosyltransferase
VKTLSLIIPCYNEASNLPLLINRCVEVLKQREGIEVIIVDNGSIDESSEVLDHLLKNQQSIRRVKVEINKGYGYGILTGLGVAKGEILGWTHADMQTDLSDVLKGLDFFDNVNNPERIFAKGKRYGRPFFDIFFSVGMAIFETFLMRKMMWDINAQPTMFHRTFFQKWSSPPNDFSLDLYAYYIAKVSSLEIKRFPVLFGKRAHGTSHWNVSFSAKIRFVKRTLQYSFALQKRSKHE